MKKLNRKGFTLIELLAVIVIMAIILVVTLPYILDSVGNAKISSIHNLAKSAAKSYTDMAAADMIAPTGQKQLEGLGVGATWKCIDDAIATKLGISKDDIVDAADKNAELTTGVYGADAKSDVTASGILATTCSAIRFNGGSAEILLIAQSNGKFADTEGIVYGLSSDSNGRIK